MTFECRVVPANEYGKPFGTNKIVRFETRPVIGTIVSLEKEVFVMGTSASEEGLLTVYVQEESYVGKYLRSNQNGKR